MINSKLTRHIVHNTILIDPKALLETKEYNLKEEICTRWECLSEVVLATVIEDSKEWDEVWERWAQIVVQLYSWS